MVFYRQDIKLFGIRVFLYGHPKDASREFKQETLALTKIRDRLRSIKRTKIMFPPSSIILFENFIKS